MGYETPFSTIVISDCTSKILAKFVSASKKALRKSYLTFFEQTTGMVLTAILIKQHTCYVYIL
jgi:hypothetical protein